MAKYDKAGNLKTVNVKTMTKFDPGVFDRYLEHCSKGGSIPQFCRNEKIGRPTFDAWIEKYDTTKEIKARGKLWAEGWWMEQAQENLVIHNDKDAGTTKFDTNLYKYVTGGRFGHTSEKEIRDILINMQETMRSQATVPLHNTAYAEEAECEDDSKPE